MHRKDEHRKKMIKKVSLIALREHHRVTLRHSHSKIYFCFRSSNVAEIFRGGVSRTRHLTVKISARNIEPSKIYLEIMGENVGVSASQISLAFQTLESSDWF
jgi:hypothetical protein